MGNPDSMIVKVCKVHGELEKDECFIQKNNYIRCKKCKNIAHKKYRDNANNKNKYSERKKKWNKNNPDKVKKYNKKRDEKVRLYMRNNYIITLLKKKGFLKEDITADLIITYRELIKLKRTIREKKNAN